jgi:hypothetical protein
MKIVISVFAFTLLFIHTNGLDFDSIKCRLNADNNYLKLKGSILFYNNKEIKTENDSCIVINNPSKIINLKIINSDYHLRFDTTINIENLNSHEFIWTLKDSRCSGLSVKDFEEKIKIKQFDLYIQYGDPPFRYPSDKLLSEEYKVTIHIFGCISPYSQLCMENYNKLMANHLDKIYKREWRKYLRHDLKF